MTMTMTTTNREGHVPPRIKSLNMPLTTGDIARICKVAPRTVSKWIDKGTLRGYRLPDSQDRRVTRADLDEFMNKYQILGGVPTLRRILAIGTTPELASSLGSEFTELRKFRVEYAASGFGAGIRLRASRPSVIVIDLAMGRIEAAQIVDGARSIHGDDMPIVVLASSEAPEQIDILMCDRIVRKPFEIADLIGAIHQLIS